MKVVAFDLEIAKEIPEGADWDSLRPLGISCAATLSIPLGGLRLWHGERLEDSSLPRQMTPLECYHLFAYLETTVEEGYSIVTFNGLGFDFRTLYEECQDPLLGPRFKHLALGHVDIAFALFCHRGFMISLDTAANGMGLQGKTKGMDGALAPVMWAKGVESQTLVLDYVRQDAQVTLNLFKRITETRYLRWISQSGNVNYWLPPDKQLKTVKESLELPEPDTSWMREAWPREKFTGWMEAIHE